MKHLILAAALAACSIAAARNADACWNDYYSQRKVLGVGPDGWFAVARTSWSEAGDGVEHAITVHDASGEVVESFGLSPGNEAWNHENGDSAKAAPRLARLALDNASPKAASERIAAQLHLTPLRPLGVPFRHVKSGVRCGSIERQTKSGFVRIADVGEQDFLRQFCRPITATGFSHPSSELEFVRQTWSYGAPHPDGAGEQASDDGFTWYPKRRVEGLELAIRGQRELDAGHATAALPMIERSIELAPEYVPSRRALVWAAARADAPWDRLQAKLLTPLPHQTSCIAWAERDAWMDLPRKNLPWKQADAITSPEAEWPWDACRTEASRFYRVNAKGEAVQ